MKSQNRPHKMGPSGAYFATHGSEGHFGKHPAPTRKLSRGDAAKRAGYEKIARKLRKPMKLSPIHPSSIH